MHGPLQVLVPRMITDASPKGVNRVAYKIMGVPLAKGTQEFLKVLLGTLDRCHWFFKPFQKIVDSKGTILFE